MHNYIYDELIHNGYKIENARITKADISMEDHGCITMSLALSGGGFGVVYGGYCLGHGYLGAKEFDSSPNAMEYIGRIMDTVGVTRFSALEGKYVRIASKSRGETLKIIGNIIDDKWFDAESFFLDLENN